MSVFEIKMPKLGESITEGTIMKWLVKTGDTVKEDQGLFEVETQKVSAEIPSPVAGKVIEILFKEGDTIPVGAVIARIDLQDSESDTIQSDTTAPAPAPAPAAGLPETERNPSGPVKEATTEKTPKEESARWYSPVVLQLAQDAKISKETLDTIPGTGYLGRLSKKDIEQYIDQQRHAAPVPEAKPPVTPVAEEDTVKEMDSVRRAIADHMVMSKHTSPHVTTIIEVDVTKLAQWRERVKDEFFRREGVKLTLLPAITEATAKALLDFPQVNASVKEHSIILKKQINIGIAVALDNGNLVVPVIHQADKMNLKGIASSIESLAAKARSNKLKLEDVQGGTFSITNFGSVKNIIATPIINQPQLAILGVGYAEKKPAVIETPQGDVIAIRHKMYLSLSFDHRAVDGALGGAFLRRIGDYLENFEPTQS